MRSDHFKVLAQACDDFSADIIGLYRPEDSPRGIVLLHNEHGIPFTLHYFGCNTDGALPYINHSSPEGWAIGRWYNAFDGASAFAKEVTLFRA